jgi:hypothetical protein
MKFIVDKFFHFGDVFSGYYENITKRNANVDGYMCQFAMIIVSIFTTVIRLFAEPANITLMIGLFITFIVASYFYSIRLFFNSSAFKMMWRNSYFFIALFLFFSINGLIQSFFYQYSINPLIRLDEKFSHFSIIPNLITFLMMLSNPITPKKKTETKTNTVFG